MADQDEALADDTVGMLKEVNGWQGKRITELESENRRLRCALSELGGERAVLDALCIPEGVE